MLFISVRQINLFLTSISSDVSSSEVVAERRWSSPSHQWTVNRRGHDSVVFPALLSYV